LNDGTIANYRIRFNRATTVQVDLFLPEIYSVKRYVCKTHDTVAWIAVSRQSKLFYCSCVCGNEPPPPLGLFHVRPSAFFVQNISSMLFDVGSPNFVWYYIMGWRSVAHYN